MALCAADSSSPECAAPSANAAIMPSTCNQTSSDVKTSSDVIRRHQTSSDVIR